MTRHDTNTPSRRRHRSVALVVAVKVVIVALVLALPSWLAVSLGAAHLVALLLVAVAAAVLLALRIVRNREPRVTVPDSPMVTAEAHVQTTNASRYLVQLCEHATKFSQRLRHLHATRERPEVLGVDWSDTHGTLDLSWGRCTMDAHPTTLTVRVEAADEENLRRVRDIVTADLERFGRRDGVTVTWEPS